MKYMMKVHEVVRYGIREVIVALCDPELVGRTLKEGEVEFFVNPRFYEGELVEEEEAKSWLERATIANFVGENSVELGIKAGLVDPENVKRIGKVAHAQTVLMLE
ncbi:MAG TPA: DUF424 family protein [Candidatus Aenigmarchaeota archaeon]|nr:DUF424 family protein [Candidatus Aenigmarchaeota archaeon]